MFSDNVAEAKYGMHYWDECVLSFIQSVKAPFSRHIRKMSKRCRDNEITWGRAFFSVFAIPGFNY